MNLLSFTASLLPSGSYKTGKLAFKPEEKNGRTLVSCSIQLRKLE
jgi:hypothetical protein